MSDVKDARGIENQQGQGSYNPYLYAENNLGARLEPQAWQAQANANAQKSLPTFEESSTNNGANRDAPQQNPTLVQDSTSRGADKYKAQQNPVMVQESGRPNRAPKPEQVGPSQPNPDKLDTSVQKYGTSDKGKVPGNKLNDKLGESDRKLDMSPNQPRDNENINIPPADANDGKEHIEKSPADAKEGEEHIDKSPADAANPDGSEHMEKSEADATEDESDGSFSGDGESSSSDGGNNTTRDREKEKAKEVFESIGGTSAPRTFNSVGEAAAEALKALRNQ